MRDPSDQTADALRSPQSTYVKSRLVAAARVHFMLGGMIVMLGNGARSASVLGLSLALWETGAMEALLAGSFILTKRSRLRLATIFSVALLLPVAGLIGIFVEQARQPFAPEASTTIVAGCCGVAANVIDAALLARFRKKGVPPARGAIQALITTVPTSIIVIMVGLATATHRTGAIDLAAGVVIALFQCGSPECLRRIARLDLPASAWGGEQVRFLAGRYPRLKLLLSPKWQDAAAKKWAQDHSWPAPSNRR